MAWKRGPQDFSRLHMLGNLTARLIRLSLFERIQRGDAQLRARGIKSELSDIYQEHALSQRHTLIPQKQIDLENPIEFVRTTDTEGNSF